MSNKSNFKRNLTFFGFLFRAIQPEVEMPEPQRDCVVSEIVLYLTVIYRGSNGLLFDVNFTLGKIS